MIAQSKDSEMSQYRESIFHIGSPIYGNVLNR
jgi:hypothetical protein